MSRDPRRGALVLALCAALAACGPSSGAGDRDGGTGGDGGASTPDAGPPAPDLGSGTWTLENVSQSPDAMGFYGRLGFLAGGARQVAWSEVDPVNLSDYDVYTAARSQDAWSPTPLVDNDQQQTYPSMVSDGQRLYLAWSGKMSADDDYDIFLAVYDGGSWGSPVDLTSSFEDQNPPADIRPGLAIDPSGELIVAYVNDPFGANEEVRVVRVREGDVSAPVTVIPHDTAVCSEVAVAVDPKGSVHLVGSCNGLYYVTDETGPWEGQPLEFARSASEHSPKVVANDHGLHLVFRGDLPCGDSNCGDIFYVRRPAGGDFGRAINISASPDVMDVLPVFDVDRWGRILIAYKALGAGDARDRALFSYSEDGQIFTPPAEVAPDAPATQDDEPTDLEVDPQSGLPSMTFIRVFRGTDPLNIDIFSADFSPGGS